MEYLISLSPWTWVMVVTLASVATTAWFAFFAFSNPVTETEMLPEATSSRLPIIGDSAHFLWQGPHRFVANQISRFQEFFKLSILGLDPIIVGTSPEFVKFVLANKSFRPSYPTRLTKLVSGDYNIHSLKRIQIDTLARRCTFGKFSGENLHKHLPFLNSLASQVVDSLQSMGTILNIESEIVKYTTSAAFQLAWPELVGTEDANKIKEEILKIQDGTHSNIHINLPPFTWYKALKATTSLLGYIQKSLAKRREKGIQYEDILGLAMEEASAEQLSDHAKSIAIRGALFGATTGAIASLTMVVKYLHDYPQVKESIKVEQDALRDKMIEGNSLEWFNWKTSMPLTTQMINEVLRHHSVVLFIPREAPKNMKYKDYNIPKKWQVWTAPCAIHMNPKIFPNPTAFYPSRFQTPPTLGTFIPFGIGPRMCPGMDLAMTEMLLLIHHLVTKCRWESLGPNRPIEYSHDRQLKGGFPMIVQKCG